MMFSYTPSFIWKRTTRSLIGYSGMQSVIKSKGTALHMYRYRDSSSGCFLFFGIWSRQYDIRPLVNCIRQAGGTKKPFCIDVFCPDGKITPFFQCMGKYIVTGKTPVSYKNWTSTIGIAVYQAAYCGKLIFFPSWLNITSRYLLENSSNKEMVWIILNPFFDLPPDGWNVVLSSGLRAMLNSEPSTAVREYFSLNSFAANWTLNCLRRW